MSFTIFSFGFRYGAPEADEVFDLRCLKNPYWEPELRELCSQDAPVRDFILHNEQSRTVLNYGLREHGHTVTVFHRDLSREGNA